MTDDLRTRVFRSATGEGAHALANEVGEVVDALAAARAALEKSIKMVRYVCLPHSDFDLDRWRADLRKLEAVVAPATDVRPPNRRYLVTVRLAEGSPSRYVGRLRILAPDIKEAVNRAIAEARDRGHNPAGPDADHDVEEVLPSNNAPGVKEQWKALEPGHAGVFPAWLPCHKCQHPTSNRDAAGKPWCDDCRTAALAGAPDFYVEAPLLLARRALAENVISRSALAGYIATAIEAAHTLKVRLAEEIARAVKAEKERDEAQAALAGTDAGELMATKITLATAMRERLHIEAMLRTANRLINGGVRGTCEAHEGCRERRAIFDFVASLDKGSAVVGSPRPASAGTSNAAEPAPAAGLTGRPWTCGCGAGHTSARECHAAKHPPVCTCDECPAHGGADALTAAAQANGEDADPLEKAIAMLEANLLTRVVESDLERVLELLRTAQREQEELRRPAEKSKPDPTAHVPSATCCAEAVKYRDERTALSADRDRLRAELARAVEERDAMRAGRDGLLAERDALREDVAREIGLRNSEAEECNAAQAKLEAERDAALAKLAALEPRLETLLTRVRNRALSMEGIETGLASCLFLVPLQHSDAQGGKPEAERPICTACNCNHPHRFDGPRCSCDHYADHPYFAPGPTP